MSPSAALVAVGRGLMLAAPRAASLTFPTSSALLSRPPLRLASNGSIASFSTLSSSPLLRSPFRRSQPSPFPALSRPTAPLFHRQRAPDCIIFLLRHPTRPFSSSLSSSSAPSTASSSTSPPPNQPHSIPSTPVSQSSLSRSTPIPPAPASSSTIPLHTASVELDSDPSSAPPLAGESQLRRLFRQYGAVAVGSYLTIYVSTLGLLYVAVKERWVGGMDVQHWMDWLGMSGYLEKLDPRSGDFAVAWIATKVTEPLRLGLTAVVTPTIARWLGSAPPKEQTLAERVKEAARGAKEGIADVTHMASSASGQQDSAKEPQQRQPRTHTAPTAHAAPAGAATAISPSTSPASSAHSQAAQSSTKPTPPSP